MFTSRIEDKALRTGNREIHKLKLMKDRRHEADAPFRKHLDIFVDRDARHIVMDSAKLTGGRFIANYLMK